MSSEPHEYVVKKGDCLTSIAEREGFFWQTLWEENPELRERRRDPNALLAGDVVRIPATRVRRETGATDQRHRFRKKGIPAKLRLVLENEDVALADERYVLTIGAEHFEGRTDGQGLLEVSIPAHARQGRLEIAGLVYELEIGGIDPIEEPTGIQDRLQNLGFYQGEIDGEFGDETRNALMEFQSFSGLEPTGELDDATRTALEERHDREHEAAEPEPSAEEEPESRETSSQSDADFCGDEPEDYDEDLDDEAQTGEEDDEPEVPDDESD